MTFVVADADGWAIAEAFHFGAIYLGLCDRGRFEDCTARRCAQAREAFKAKVAA